MGSRFRRGWVLALLGGCLYDSASIDADPFDGLTLVPTNDAGNASDGGTEDPRGPAAEAARDAAGPVAVSAPAGSLDAGAAREQDATAPVRSDGPADAAADDASVVSVDAGPPGTVPRDGGVMMHAASTDPASYACADLSYESFGRAFVKKFCNDCHSVQKPTLLTLEAVALHKVALEQTTVITRRMPLQSGSVPTQAQRVQFGVWLRCGPY